MPGKVIRVLVLVTVVSAVSGFAASLQLTTANLGAFALDGKGCQQSPPGTELVFDTDEEDNPTTLRDVEVSGIDGTCSGKSMHVAVVDENGTLQGERRNVTVDGSSTQVVHFDSHVTIAHEDADAAHAIIPK